jgi:hypothetical protein
MESPPELDAEPRALALLTRLAQTEPRIPTRRIDLMESMLQRLPAKTYVAFCSTPLKTLGNVHCPLLFPTSRHIPLGAHAHCCPEGNYSGKVG